MSEPIVFEDDSKTLVLEDIEPVLCFQDESRTLQFDEVQEGIFDETLPTDGLIQWIAKNEGLAIYNDTTGILGDAGKWYFQDNVQGKKLRQPQPGRGYNFTTIETLTFQETITTIVDQDGTDLSPYLSGQVLTPPAGNIYTIIVNGIAYDLEESSGIVSYRSIAGDIATINLNGSSESNFHITSNQVQSVANRVGFSPSNNAIQFSQNFDQSVWVKLLMTVTPDSSTAPDGTNTATLCQTTVGGDVQIHQDLQGVVPVSGRTFTFSIYIKGIGTSVGKLTAMRLLSFGPGGTESFVQAFTLTSSWERFHITATMNNNNTVLRCRLDYVETASIGDEVYIWGAQLTETSGVVNYYRTLDSAITALIPIDQSGDGKTDVLGNTVAKNQFGQVQYPTQIKENATGYFDGVLVLTFSDLSGRSIVSQEGIVTVQIVGNTIQPVSGTGEVFYLEFDNGSYYRFIETAGPVTHDWTSNGLNGTWTLNGSAQGSQDGTHDKQRPNQILEGFQLYQKADNPDIYVPLGITVDPAITGDGYTKTGDVPGHDTSLNSSTSTAARNPFDTPDLSMMGIPSSDNRTFAQIVADLSSFYDNSEEDKVVNMLAYQDFPEPIAGSVGNFDGTISLSHPNLTAITISSWEGTATPTKSGNDILVTTGTLLELILSDGSRYIWSEEKGLVVYDLLKQNNLTTNLNGSASGTQYLENGNKNYTHKYEYGYYDDGNSLVPGDINNPGFALDGNPIDNQEEVNKFRRINNYIRKD